MVKVVRAKSAQPPFGPADEAVRTVLDCRQRDLSNEALRTTANVEVLAAEADLLYARVRGESAPRWIMTSYAYLYECRG